MRLRPIPARPSIIGGFALATVAVLSGCGSANPTVPATSGAASPSAAAAELTCSTPPAIPKSSPKYSLPNKATAAGKTFIAQMKTNCGTITLELDGTKAPQTVASFLQLSKTCWTDTKCHRLVTDGIYVLQCGDPTGTGSGPGPGYTFGLENAPASGDYPAGTLAMARTDDPNSNGDQFFMVYADSQLLASGYSVFGKVTSGLNILTAIAERGVAADGVAPAQPISILSITVTEKKA